MLQIENGNNKIKAFGENGTFTVESMAQPINEVKRYGWQGKMIAIDKG